MENLIPQLSILATSVLAPFIAAQLAKGVKLVQASKYRKTLIRLAAVVGSILIATAKGSTDGLDASGAELAGIAVDSAVTFLMAGGVQRLFKKDEPKA